MTAPQRENVLRKPEGIMKGEPTLGPATGRGRRMHRLSGNSSGLGRSGAPSFRMLVRTCVGVQRCGWAMGNTTSRILCGT